MPSCYRNLQSIDSSASRALARRRSCHVKTLSAWIAMKKVSIFRSFVNMHESASPLKRPRDRRRGTDRENMHYAGIMPFERVLAQRSCTFYIDRGLFTLFRWHAIA